MIESLLQPPFCCSIELDPGICYIRIFLHFACHIVHTRNIIIVWECPEQVQHTCNQYIFAIISQHSIVVHVHAQLNWIAVQRTQRTTTMHRNKFELNALNVYLETLYHWKRRELRTIRWWVVRIGRIASPVDKYNKAACLHQLALNCSNLFKYRRSRPKQNRCKCNNSW